MADVLQSEALSVLHRHWNTLHAALYAGLNHLLCIPAKHHSPTAKKEEDMHVHNQTGSYHQKSDDRPCSYFAAESWNSLPSGIRFAKTLATFKSQQSPTFSSSTSLINNPNNCTIF